MVSIEIWGTSRSHRTGGVQTGRIAIRVAAHDAFKGGIAVPAVSLAQNGPATGMSMSATPSKTLRRGLSPTNLLVRDMDLDVPVNDGRRLELVVDGPPLFGGAQFSVDTMLVSVLHTRSGGP